MNLLKLLKAASSLVRHGPLIQDGWVRSYLENQSVDREGNPIPWITYPALDFLSERLSSVKSVFEFGSGNGTLWWAEKSPLVRAVEHNKSWYDKMKKIVPENVQLFYEDLQLGSNYENKILLDNCRYDLIIIDGRRRNECMVKSPERITNAGVIVLDNSDRAEYKQGIKYLFDRGFRVIQFSGFCPIVNFKSQTAIFYRSRNTLGI